MAQPTKAQRLVIERARVSMDIGTVLGAYALAKRLGLNDTAEVLGYQLERAIRSMQARYPGPARVVEDED
jgi:hypothetical protein